VDVVVEATPLPIVGSSLPKADPCVIVIFGALSDLAIRKLGPALFDLAGAGCLSSRFKVLGMARDVTEIVVHFKRTPQALFARAPEGKCEPNVIVLRIQPDEGIIVAFGAKRPGAEMEPATVHMDFCYRTAFGAHLPSAYETLLLDVMQGDATLFIRRDEIEKWAFLTGRSRRAGMPEIPESLWAGKGESQGHDSDYKNVSRGGERSRKDR